MAKSDVKLMGEWTSPYVLRPMIALNIKSVDYEFIEEIFGAKSELLLKSNPVHKKIPVLIHGEKPISESVIIVQYTDETWSSGPSILPSDPYERAIVRFWSAYIDEKWYPSLSGITRAPTDEAKKAAIAQATEGLALLEEAFTKCSNGKPFFGGDRIGYLDITLGSLLGWLRVCEKFNGLKLIDASKTPHLVQWADNFCSDAAVKGVMPETDKLAEFAKVLMAKLRAVPPQ